MKSWRDWAAVWFVWASLLAGCGSGKLDPGKSALRISPEKVDFGKVALGGETLVEMSLSNGGRTSYNISELAATVPNVRVKNFESFTIEAGETRKFSVVFSPTVEGKVDGAFSVRTDEASDPRHVPLTGVGVKAFVEISAQTLDFGRVELETTSVKSVSLRNPTGVAAPVRFTLEGNDIDEFSSALTNKSMVVDPGTELSIPVAFQPIRPGLASANLRFDVCPGCDAMRVDLTGEGTRGDLELFPSRVDFGRVSLGSTAEVTVTLLNTGTEDVAWNGAQLSANAPTDLLELDSPPSTTLHQNDRVEVKVRFSPKTQTVLSGVTLKLDVTTKTSPNGLTLPVMGEGALSCVTILPNAIDYGTVPEGMSSTRSVDVLNRCKVEVTLLDSQASTDQGGFFSMAQPPAAHVIAVGAVEKVKVTYLPKPASGESLGKLTLKIQEGNAIRTQVVSLRGDTRVFPPCTAAFIPSQLDFGAVPVGAELNLGLAFRNTGTEQCFIGGMQLAAGSDPAFTSNDVPSDMLDPGGQVTLWVTFKPMAVGSFSALAEAWINNPTQNHPVAPIIGQAVQGCFKLQPVDVDWGTRKLTCAPLTRTIEGSNSCTGPVALSAVVLDAPATTEFTLITQPAIPMILNPGQRTNFVARYVPVDDGDDSAALRVTADGVSYTASLSGAGQNDPARTDLFLQDSLAKVDVLFVIDNSGSMMEEQQSLGQNFAAFLTAAQMQNVDYRIAVTTTGMDPSPGGWSECPGGAEGGEAGRFFPVDNSSPRIITPTTPNAATVFENNVKVGWCHWNEQGIEAAYKALSPPLVNSADDPATPQANDGNAGFLRSDAKLAIVFLSDENDYSPNAPNDDVSFYETFFRSVKNNDASMLSISAIVGPLNLSTCPTASSSGIRQIKLAQATGGVIESICTANWGQSLVNIGANVFGPQRIFHLTETPSDPTRILVVVNGVTITTGWTYDSKTNTVEFTPGSSPPPGSVVQITYPLGC